MRGLGLPVYILFALILILGILFVPGVMKPAPERGSAKPSLSGEQRRTLDQAEKALLENRPNDARSLLAPLQDNPDLRVRLLIGELQGPSIVISPAQLSDLEREVRADRGLAAVYHLARITESTGNLPKALSYFQELASVSYLPPDFQTPVQMSLASLSAALGDHPKAIQVCLRLLQRHPANEDLFKLLLRSLRTSKGKVKPEFLADLADRHHPSHFDCQWMLAGFLFDLGLKDEGLRRLEICRKLAPMDTQILSQLYVRYRSSRQWDRALDALQRCFDLEHPFPKQAQVSKASFEAAREAATLGRGKQAFFFLRYALLRDRSLLEGGGEAVFNTVSDLIQKEGNTEEKAVLAVFWKFMNGEPREAMTAAHKLGAVLTDQALARDIGQIQNACQGILEGDQAYQRYLQQLESKSRPTSAGSAPPLVAASTPASAAPPKSSPEAASAAASPADDFPGPTGDPKIDPILEEARSFAGNASRQLLAADNLMLLQAWEPAEKLMKRLSAKDPTDAQARYRLGLIAFQFQRFEDASDHLQEALRLKPEDAKVRAKLARVLAQRGDYPQALEEAKAALARESSLPEARLVLGQVFYNRGRNDEALEEVNKGLAVEFDSTSETFAALNKLRDDISGKR